MKPERAKSPPRHFTTQRGNPIPRGNVKGDHILIVDNNPTNLKLDRVLLTSEGYQVRTAMDAEETLALLQLAHPRLFLMDFQLPGVQIIATYLTGSGPASGAPA